MKKAIFEGVLKYAIRRLEKKKAILEKELKETNEMLLLSRSAIEEKVVDKYNK